MYSHINSERRKKLNDLSPFEAFSSVVENSQVIMWIWDIECARWCYVMGYESECGPDLIMSLVYNESWDYYEMGDVCENEFDNRHYIYGIYPSGSRPKVNTIIKHLRKLKHGTPVVG